ncbi:MerR family transcriptional regulator [Streptomyces sp. NPDC004787]|uniref:MerR family transcriptional regulator n=1 Tax=Streptomyces sp. NPDC004787 TaxID=3154291 RepID=UPI0033A67F90
MVIGECSIAELAKASGVTSRTLRHYDAIGLLPADRTSSGGVRYYSKASVLRLQQILILRKLGLGLAEISGIVDEDTDPLTALRRHLMKVLAERDRFDRLAATVATTIAHLEGGKGMKPEELFTGLDPVKQAQYEAELVGKYGKEAEEHIEQSKRRMSGWDKPQAQLIAAK